MKAAYLILPLILGGVSLVASMTALSATAAAPADDAATPPPPRSAKPAAAAPTNTSTTLLRLDDGDGQAVGGSYRAASSRFDDWVADIPSRSRNSSGARSLELLLSETLTHDTNLLRLPKNVNPVAAAGVSSKADTSSATAVGLRIDKEYALQRFQIDVTETAYRHTNLSFLNYQALEYRGAWLWRVTPRWSGVVATDRVVTLASLADTAIAQRNRRNLQTSENLRLTLDGSLGGGWHVLLGGFVSQVKFDQAILPQNSTRTRGADAGVRYVSAAGNSVSLVQRATQGDFLNRAADVATVTDNGFRRNETELRMDWNVSGKSLIQSRLAWSGVHHEHFAARDFSGFGGEVAYVWSATDKLRLDVVARRDLSQWWQTSSSYRVDDTLSIAPTWRASSKTNVRFRLDRKHSDFLGPVFPLTSPLRSDTAYLALVGVDWTPVPNVVLDAGLQRQRRSSNTALVDFDSTIASINARVRF